MRLVYYADTQNETRMVVLGRRYTYLDVVVGEIAAKIHYVFDNKVIPSLTFMNFLHSGFVCCCFGREQEESSKIFFCKRYLSVDQIFIVCIPAKKYLVMKIMEAVSNKKAT